MTDPELEIDRATERLSGAARGGLGPGDRTRDCAKAALGDLLDRLLVAERQRDTAIAALRKHKRAARLGLVRDVPSLPGEQSTLIERRPR